MQAHPTTLYYIHDPMCSWCWAFRPVWQQLQQQLPASLNIIYLLGGLAADSHSPMPASMQQEIQQHWRTIQQRVPGSMFNFDFWTQCQPRRSTYPACRAVIAARKQGAQYEQAIIDAIQTAYYLEARNPSDDSTLMNLAMQLHLHNDQFRSALHAPETQTRLLQEIRQAQQMQAYAMPSLILHKNGINHPIAIDYNHANNMLEKIHAVS